MGEAWLMGGSCPGYKLPLTCRRHPKSKILRHPTQLPLHDLST